MTEVDQLTCPTCAYAPTQEARDAGNAPEQGDVVVCGECGTICEAREGGRLFEMDTELLRILHDNNLETFVAVMRTSCAVKHRNYHAEKH